MELPFLRSQRVRHAANYFGSCTASRGVHAEREMFPGMPILRHVTSLFITVQTREVNSLKEHISVSTRQLFVIDSQPKRDEI